MQVGDVVLAVGNPLGIGQTVTMGIISAKGRSTGVGDGSYEDFLQTDAPINHGNSGGALVNTKGELVGINSQIVSHVRRQHRHRLRDSGQHGASCDGRPARRGSCATRAARRDRSSPSRSDLAESLGLKQVGGAIVSCVESGSAADHAGIKRGDVIKSFNGQAVQDTNTLRNRVAEATPGSSATVVVMRDGSEHELSGQARRGAVSKTAQGRGEPTSDDHAALGVSVAPLTPELAERAGIVETRRVSLWRMSIRRAARRPPVSRPRDVIQEVNRKPVQTRRRTSSSGEERVRSTGSAAGQPRRPRLLRDRQALLALGAGGWG